MQLQATAKGTGTQSGLLGQGLKGRNRRRCRYQRVACIFPGWNRRQGQSFRRLGGKILETVDRQIDLMLQKGLFDLFDKQSLDTGCQFRKVGVGCLIPRCADDLDSGLKIGMVFFEGLLKKCGLPERQLTGPGSDHEFPHESLSRRKIFRMSWIL